MTKFIIAAFAALTLSLSVAQAAQPGWGRTADTGAYAAGGTLSDTPLHGSN